jgi:hypothetical protein
MPEPVPTNPTILRDPSIVRILEGTVFVFILLCLALYFRVLDSVVFLAFVGILLTVSALLVALVIAATQTIQLNKQKDEISELSKIQKATKDTADKLESNSIIHDRVNRFFLLHGDVNTKFELFFPVEYAGKPLPVINQGDFYAIHVISSRLKEGTIVNYPVPRKYKPKPGEKVEEKPDTVPGDRAIFICRPDINYILGSLWKTWTIDASGSPVKHDSYDLPCWFTEKEERTEGDTAGNPPTVLRNIFVSYYEGARLIQSPVDSPSEEFYKKAAELGSGKKYTPGSATYQSDYGILARIHDKDNKVRIIVAGIHQLGTWVVGRLLSRLFYGETVDGMATFIGDKDFIAIIEGKFFDDQWKVTDEQVHSKYIWTRENDKWTRVIDPKKNPDVQPGPFHPAS